MVTPTEITNYLLEIYEAQSIFMDSVVLKEKLGHTDVFCDRVKGTLLDMYVQIMVDFFNRPTAYDTYNFFTTEEVEDIMLRINLICDTNYTLNI
jgi:hypothetical protein